MIEKIFPEKYALIRIKGLKRDGWLSKTIKRRIPPGHLFISGKFLLYWETYNVIR